MDIIGITLGCPAGIGPEIILHYFQKEKNDALPAVVIGDRNVLRRCAESLQLDVSITSWQPGIALPDRPAIPILEVTRLDDSEFFWGQPNVVTGRAMARYIETAIDLATQGILAGITTCPIAKTTLQSAGYPFPGHTEMLAELTGCRDYAMMLAGSDLRVILVTIHTSLRSVPDSLTTAEITRIIRLTHRSLQVDFALDIPRIGVAGLNPHGGEGGIFGDEERLIIAPAISRCQAEGITVTGPLPPDTIFHQAANHRFDGVVCMYHDQGLIPFKLLHFEDGVNLTLGLPIVRTSVDHGTAYDIAGRGIASHASLREAVRLASVIAENRKARHPQQKDGL